MEKYLINGEEVTKEEFESRLADDIREEVSNYYDDFLDETYEEIKIGSLTYCPSTVLAKCDPVAYDLGKDDLADARYSDYIYELSSYGEEEEVNKNTYLIADVEEHYQVVVTNDDDEEEIKDFDEDEKAAREAFQKECAHTEANADKHIMLVKVSSYNYEEETDILEDVIIKNDSSNN